VAELGTGVLVGAALVVRVLGLGDAGEAGLVLGVAAAWLTPALGEVDG
jgi:hypothetical protein